MHSRGLKPTQTRAKNGGSALAVLRQQGGYRINKDGSISFAAEVLEEKKEKSEKITVEKNHRNSD